MTAPHAVPTPTTAMPAAPPRGGRVARLAQRVLAACYRLAESGWGGAAVGGWAFLQGSVVPGPTDAVIVPLGVADPKRVFRLAAYAIAGALAGGSVAYAIGAGAFGDFAPRLLELAGVSEAMLERMRTQFATRGWLLVVASTVSPLSSKIVCFAAGMLGLPFIPFILALAAGRSVRNLAIATVLRLAGPALLAKIARRAGMTRPDAAAPPAPAAE